MKGKVMQYHRNISKEDGAQLYSKFISSCKDTFDTNNKVKCINKTVESGTYGNRQVFTTDTNGPYTHVVEL